MKKKLQFLFSVVTLMCFALIANAQPEAGKYYVQNVGTQKYLAAGNSWGTHAVVNATGLDYELALVDDKYTFESQVSNGGNNHYLNGEWNDGAAFGWTIAQAGSEPGVYTISDGSKYLAAGANDDVTLVEGITDAAKWKFRTLSERLADLASATPEAPVNATFLIADANFGRNDLRKSAWTVSADCTNKNLSGGNNINNCAESFHSTFTLSQVIANAPAGKYKLTAQGFYRQDGDDTESAPVFYANDKTKEFFAKSGSEGDMSQASESFTAGNYTIEAIEVTVFDDGQLTIGAQSTALNQWAIFDNFQLTYLTSEIPAEEFAPAFTEARNAAMEALGDNAYIAVTGDERNALIMAIRENDEPNTTAEMKAAISAINGAKMAFTEAKAAYEALINAKLAINTAAWPYASADKKLAVETAISAEATSAADATAKTAALVKAYRQFIESNALAEGVEGAVNMTDKIVNPAAEEAIADPWSVVKGEGSGGSLNILNGEPWTDGSDNSTHKYFDGGDWGQSAWDVSLAQEVTLEPGKYVLTAVARASSDVTLTLFAGDNGVIIPSVGASGGVFDRGWNDAFVVFEVEEAGAVKIGVQGVTSVVHNWMSFSNFRLVQIEAPAAPVEPIVNKPLTKDMFKGWDGVGADANIVDENPAQEDVTLGTEFGAGKTVYGNGSVLCNSYADITGTTTMRINAAAGMQFRVLINRKAVGDGGGDGNGGALVELNPTVPEGATYVDVDFSEYEFVHINAIKTGWGSSPGVIESFILNPTDDTPATYDITVLAEIENGTVVTNPADKAEAGATVTITATPNDGYEVESISVVSGEGAVITVADDNTFEMPAAAVRVSATFKSAVVVDPNDYTSYIANADLTGEGGFDATGTKGIDGSGIVKAANNAQFDFKQTISNLPAGQYKLTAQAAYRYSGSEADEYAAIVAETDTKLATLYATVGEKTENAKVQNRYDGASDTDYANGDGSVVVNEKYVPNSSNAVKAWFAAGKYVNEVTFNLPADGDVTIGIAKDAQPEAGDYTVIGPWTLTRIGDAIEPEPEPEPTPGILATLVHTASSSKGSETFTNTVDADKEHVNNANFSNNWAGAAYAEFSLADLPNGATITSAMLGFVGVGESRSARNTDVMYVNAGEVIDYATITESTDGVNLPANLIQSVSFPKGASEGFNVDVTDAVKAITEAQKYIIFKWTNNPGGGDVLGKANMDAPKLYIQYIPGAPEIANASFDVEGDFQTTNIATAADANSLAVSEWTSNGGAAWSASAVFGYGSEGQINGVTVPATGKDGNATGGALGISVGWGGVVAYTQEVTLPAGDYKLTVDAFNGLESATQGISQLGFVAEGASYVSSRNSFPYNEWVTDEVAFTLETETTGKIQVGLGAVSGGSGSNAKVFFDNVTLVKIPGIELALIDLQKAIDAAKAEKAKYAVGDGLFQYAAAQFETIDGAITDAEAAYTAAESKAAVEAATTTLNAVVEAFAPVQTAPAADKQYTFQLKLDGETPLYMNLTAEGITIEAEATPLSFEATENAGQYNLVAGELYVGLAGGNAWTMSTSADNKAAWAFTALGNGEYQINNLVTASRFVGTNSADKEAGKPCYADKQTSNGNVTWIIAEYVEPEPELVYLDLTEDMFKTWDGYGADATSTGPANVDFNLDTELNSGGMVAGTSTVDYLIYADITGKKEIVFEGTPGVQLRVLMNRQESNSGPLVERNPVIGEDGTAVLDISDLEYVHINAIKTGWGSPSGTISSIKYGFIPQSYDIEIAAAENGTVTGPTSALETDFVELTVTPAEGYELALMEIKDAEGNTIDYDSWYGGFYMPSSKVTITPTFQVGYVRISDVEIACDGEFDEDGDVKAVVTYKYEAAGSFADPEGNHLLDPVFYYSVFDAAGNPVVTDGMKNPMDISDETFNIFIPDLAADATYTIKITGINVMDYASFETVFEAADVAEQQFTTEFVGTRFDGYFAETATHLSMGMNLGDSGEEGCVIIGETDESNLTSIKFAGINYVGTTVPMPITLGDFVVENVTVTNNVDGSISYSCDNVTVQAGMAPYSGTLTGTQASANDAPVFTLNLKNACEFTAVFAATQAEAEAALETLTDITEVDAEDDEKVDGKYFENGKVVIYKNGVKYGVNGAFDK